MQTSARWCIRKLSLALILVCVPFAPTALVDAGTVDHCYSDIGCFPLNDEFYHPRYRPFNVRPWHRRHIRTQFELFNSHHPNGVVLRPWNRLSLMASAFNPMLETKIIVPGWLDNIDRAVWVKQLRDALLWLWAPTNIIVVRWRNFTPYTIATANTRVVGAELANLLKFIEHEINYDRSYFHLIGHSLGAHIGGYCGDRLPGLGRITALDPARPFFQGMPKSVRLDRGDARFIDAIHSDFTPENAILLLMSYGMTTPVGHVDFYPNGPALFQSGCIRDTIGFIQRGIVRGLQYSSLSVAFLESIRYLTACDHQRSHEWFIESIINRECVFVGVRCNEFEGMINGRCTCDDSPSACAIMGIHADQMYLNNVHDDLWPLASRKRHKAKHLAGLSGTPARGRHVRASNANSPNPIGHHPLTGGRQLHKHTHLGRLPTRDQIYAQFKQEADRLRRPPEPTIAGLIDLDYDDEQQLVVEDQKIGPESLDDLAFVEYLRTTLHLGPTGPIRTPLNALANADGPSAQDQDLDLDGFLSDNRQDQRRASHSDYYHTSSSPFDGHPQLLSDVDRNIENWYESTSRWFLKTNNRPNYCSNQYQVLVFVGPLTTSNGRDRLRANLLISIIGSRGQLLNQRFIPRSASLDSFTMQPFFILLEGSYSLGQIKSVAIGWEARNDPDPIQTTISFQNNLLDNIQKNVPEFRVKHPWISETVKYDPSEGFQWHKPLEGRYDDRFHDLARHAPSSSSISNSFERKIGSPARSASLSSKNTKCQQVIKAAQSGATRQYSASLGERGKRDLDHQTATQEPLQAEDYDADLDEPTSKQLQQAYSLASPISGSNFVAPADLGVSIGGMDSSDQDNSSLESRVNPSGEPSKNDGEVTIDFHNIDLYSDDNIEDLIVINQVIVSPLQANYGRAGRNAKIFCPPRPGHKLGRDQTMRLSPSMMSKCHQI